MNKNNSRRNFVKKSAALAAGVPTVLAPTGVFAGKPETTQNNDAKIDVIRFAVASDGHFGEKGTAYKMYYRNIVTWLNEEAENEGLDFCVFNGDIIHDEPKFLKEANEYFKGLKIPYYATQGNHDKVSEELWKEVFKIPFNHSFEKGDSGFILCTTSNEKGEYLCADASFVKEKLELFKSKKSVFVFLHISHKKWVDNGIDCKEITDMLESYENVACIFHGHDHDHHEAMYSGGKTYLFDGHFGGSWGQEYKGYRIVEVRGGTEVHTYQCNPLARGIQNTNKVDL
ncbi:MAG: transcriptional regulator [Thalassobius sp.]|nr:transcriptional regulator [Thalassovita sp.]